MRNEAEIESAMQSNGLDAPRLTPDAIDAWIADADYHVFPGTTTTVCCLTLANGFTVLGDSSCVSPENFNAKIGRDVAYQKARDKIWELEGYRLRQSLHEHDQSLRAGDHTTEAPVTRIDAYEYGNPSRCRAGISFGNDFGQDLQGENMMALCKEIRETLGRAGISHVEVSRSGIGQYLIDGLSQTWPLGLTIEPV